MPDESLPCRHQPKRPPERVVDLAGSAFLIFECRLCGCGIVYVLGVDDNVTGEFILPPAAA